MTRLNLSNDELLSTTRSVRKRLDLTRQVEPEVIRECLELALQAPTGSNSQSWRFLVITDEEKRRALGELYRRGFATYLEQMRAGTVPALRIDRNMRPDRRTMVKVRDSSQHLIDHIHEVPVMLVPCIRDRVDNNPVVEQAGAWGSILPAVWSFMLAARDRGLGSCWTTVHLHYEQEAAQILGIPYEEVMQVALIPVAYTIGTDFKPAPRLPLETFVHWNQW
jgi:nitroreductase